MSVFPLLAGLLTVAPPALADTKDSIVKTGGYVAPVFKAVYRPAARPIDQSRIGMDGSRAGLVFTGTVTPPWRFRVHLVIGADTFPALTSATPVDTDNNSTTDAIQTDSQEAMGNIVEEATATYQPIEQFDVRAGRMRIPFTSQSQSANTALMFPERAAPNEVFLRGTDLGGLLESNLFDGRILGSVGMFNGTGSSISTGDQRGVLYTGRLDINPLGSFGFNETSEWQGPFRLGIGSGIVHNPYTAYDSSGYPTVRVKDTRIAYSARLAFYGLYVSGEYLRRQQLDSMSSRPVWASGWYGQSGWHLPYGLEPVFRMGEVVTDESFDPRKTFWLDAGLNFYPALNATRPDRVKVTAHYLSENRMTEGERAQGFATMVQLIW
jgi:hypothetical protein